jgi:hypothetical protein
MLNWNAILSNISIAVGIIGSIAGLVANIRAGFHKKWRRQAERDLEECRRQLQAARIKEKFWKQETLRKEHL